MRQFLRVAALGLFCFGRSWAAEVFVPGVVAEGQERAEPYNLTGIIGAYESYGSGAVAAHPRVVLSCAHVVFSMDYLAWTSGAEWFAAWNSGAEPAYGTGELLSGYYYWRNYGPAAAVTQNLYMRGKDILAAEAREFNLDFVAYFHHSTDLAGGLYASVLEDGVPWISNPETTKTVTGYPMGRYASGDPDEFRLHVTGPFQGALTPELKSAKRYLTAYNLAETGSGNSGGPVWVDKADGSKALAAVLVSGQEQPESKDSMIGVHAVSRDGWRLIQSALNATGSGAPVEIPYETAGGDIPDNGTLKRTVKVSGLPKTTVAVTLDLQIKHPYKNDLTVQVRSPGRKAALVYDGETDEESSETVTLNGQQVAYFYGINPNGVWTIIIDDWASGDVGSLVSARLNISAR